VKETKRVVSCCLCYFLCCADNYITSPRGGNVMSVGDDIRIPVEQLLFLYSFVDITSISLSRGDGH